MYMWVHVQICSCRGPFIYQFMYMYVHVQIRSCTDTFKYRYVHIHVHSCTGTFIYMYIHVQIRSCTGTFMYSFVHAQICPCSYTVLKLEISNYRFPLSNHRFFHLSNFRSIEYRKSYLRKTIDLSISIHEIRLMN